MNMKENETNSFGERTPQTRDVHLPPDSASPSSPWGAWNLSHHMFSFFCFSFVFLSPIFFYFLPFLFFQGGL